MVKPESVPPEHYYIDGYDTKPSPSPPPQKSGAALFFDRVFTLIGFIIGIIILSIFAGFIFQAAQETFSFGREIWRSF